jgi:hypothetical protein
VLKKAGSSVESRGQASHSRSMAAASAWRTVAAG